MERSTDDPDGRWNAVIEESRHDLRVGAGLCLGSTLGCAYSSTIGSTAAMALFGSAVPVLGYQVWREYRLLRRLRRQRSDGTDMGASVST